MDRWGLVRKWFLRVAGYLMGTAPVPDRVNRRLARDVNKVRASIERMSGGPSFWL